jgi:ribose transport system substrate-binding protein
MRRIAVAVLGLVFAAPAFFLACGLERKTTIAVIPKGNTTIFWQSVHAGAAKAAVENGVEIIWNGPPSETDYTGQLQITDAMINRRVDAIVLAPIDRKAMVGVVERAARENVPMVIIDSGIDTEQYMARVGTDNYKGGQIAADRVGKLVNGKGTVAIVAVLPGGASTEEREKGFEDTIQGKYPNIRIVDKRFGMADVARSLLVSENILRAHPELDALFASNEASAMGAAQALRERHGRKIKLVGFDAGPSLLDDLRSGLVDSLVVQNPFKMGYEALQAAIKKLKGQPVVRINDLEPKLIDLQNLDEPEIQAYLHPDIKKYLLK